MKSWKLVLAFCCSLTILLTLFVVIAYFSLGPDIEDLGAGYQFFNEHPKRIDKNHNTIVPARVIELGSDERFIVAVQIPDITCIDNNNLNQYPQIHDHRFYWIIDKDNDHVYGPMLYDSYKQRKEILMECHQIWLNPR